MARIPLRLANSPHFKSACACGMEQQLHFTRKALSPRSNSSLVMARQLHPSDCQYWATVLSRPSEWSIPTMVRGEPVGLPATHGRKRNPPVEDRAGSFRRFSRLAWLSFCASSALSPTAGRAASIPRRLRRVTWLSMIFTVNAFQRPRVRQSRSSNLASVVPQVW